MDPACNREALRSSRLLAALSDRAVAALIRNVLPAPPGTSAVPGAPPLSLTAQWATALFSLGILERDGAWIAAGLVGAKGSVALVSGAPYAVVQAALFLLSSIGG